jgi:hypothetical protein
MKGSIKSDIRNLIKAFKNKEIEFLTFVNNKNNLLGAIFACDKKIMDKRKILLDIEKENIMTIASALRSIPKKPEEKEAEDPMESLLNRRAGGR